MVAALLRRLDGGDDEVRAHAVGDVRLLAVDTQPPSTFSARVLIEATSDPAPGSVMPSAPISSPRIAGTRYRCFCSSVPNFQIGGVAIPM